MRLSLSSIVTVVTLGMLAACKMGGSAESSNSALGTAGESCSKDADCTSPLVCIAQACTSSAAGADDADGGSASGSKAGDDSGAGSAAADTGAANGNSNPNDAGNGNPAPSSDGGTDAGNGGNPATDSGSAPSNPGADAGGTPSGGASALGQSCNSTADCGANLVCIPRAGEATGVCDIAVYPVTPTGMTCGGECETASDCCELPLGITLTSPTGSSVAIHQCQDILQLVLGGNASACANQPSPGSATGVGCFYFETYCGSGDGGNCGSSTWSCTNNTCQYAGSCQVNAANQFGGCPSESRTGLGLITNCDTTANVCEVETSGCQTDSNCGNGVPVSDVSGATCRGSDCTCYDQGCYLKCAQDIDCQDGFSCNTTTKLCEVNPPCSTNQDCVTKLSNVQAVCNAGACGIPCSDDHDCSPSGAIPSLGTFNGTVCGSAGFCVSVGCSSASDCQSSSATSVNTFCVTPAAGAGANMVVHSAITN